MVIQGIRFKAHPTDIQRMVLSQWMGCSQCIWNAKCSEERYYSTFARKYCPIGSYAPIDAAYSQFKDKELTPWLFDCPSQILRNSASNWHSTYQDFLSGECGKPRHKPKSDRGSIYLTREVFKFEVCADGVTRLFIGTKNNNIGYLSFKKHGNFKIPNSIYIKKENNEYFVSFCYKTNVGEPDPATDKENLKHLKKSTEAFLNAYVVGIDRGVSIPVQAGDNGYDFTNEQKTQKDKSGLYVKRLQKKLARQKKGSKRYENTRRRLRNRHCKIANIRKDFCHKTSHALVNSKAKIFIFENLRTKQMTQKAKPKKDENGKYIRNNARAKSGLNRAILDKGWHILETFTKYKAARAGKAVFKLPAPFTSQECANCGHTHPDNRKEQKTFICLGCGHADNADRNASLVIKKRAIKLILHTGTVLSARGVLTSSDKGRGAKSKSGPKAPVSGYEASKKNRTDTTSVVS